MDDGSSRRDHLLAAEAAGHNTGELEPRPIPSDCDVLLDTFWALRRSAGSNGMAAAPITEIGVLAWQTLWGITLEPFEVDLIFTMDHAALAAFAEKK
jgi:hypothetical protein